METRIRDGYSSEYDKNECYDGYTRASGTCLYAHGTGMTSSGGFVEYKLKLYKRKTDPGALSKIGWYRLDERPPSTRAVLDQEKEFSGSKNAAGFVQISNRELLEIYHDHFVITNKVYVPNTPNVEKYTADVATDWIYHADYKETPSETVEPGGKNAARRSSEYEYDHWYDGRKKIGAMQCIRELYYGVQSEGQRRTGENTYEPMTIRKRSKYVYYTYDIAGEKHYKIGGYDLGCWNLTHSERIWVCTNDVKENYAYFEIWNPDELETKIGRNEEGVIVEWDLEPDADGNFRCYMEWPYDSDGDQWTRYITTPKKPVEPGAKTGKENSADLFFPHDIEQTLFKKIPPVRSHASKSYRMERLPRRNLSSEYEYDHWYDGARNVPSQNLWYWKERSWGRQYIESESPAPEVYIVRIIRTRKGYQYYALDVDGEKHYKIGDYEFNCWNHEHNIRSKWWPRNTKDIANTYYFVEVNNHDTIATWNCDPCNLTPEENHYMHEWTKPADGNVYNYRGDWECYSSYERYGYEPDPIPKTVEPGAENAVRQPAPNTRKATGTTESRTTAPPENTISKSCRGENNAHKYNRFLADM